MKPLKQRFRHNPEEGIWGDCHRAAIASVLELDLDDVPHFYDKCDSRDMGEMLGQKWNWLRSKGYVHVHMLYDAPLEDVLKSVGYMNPNIYYLLGGTSRNGVGHTVVCLDSDIVHDPALDDSGIVGPMSDGYYWITFFGSAVALHSSGDAVYECAQECKKENEIA